jgi:hypothetical protein
MSKPNRAEKYCKGIRRVGLMMLGPCAVVITAPNSPGILINEIFISFSLAEIVSSDSVIDWKNNY